MMLTGDGFSRRALQLHLERIPAKVDPHQERVSGLNHRPKERHAKVSASDRQEKWIEMLASMMIGRREDRICCGRELLKNILAGIEKMCTGVTNWLAG
jgi:hypothetical protein